MVLFISEQMEEPMNNTQKKVKELYKTLLDAEEHLFPPKRQRLNAPKEKGVYIILSPRGKVLHVGNTPRAKEGVHQRLRNHMNGLSSFAHQYLEGDGDWLRGRCKFKFIVERNPKLRAYLEAYAIGNLCPEHIGAE